MYQDYIYAEKNNINSSEVILGNIDKSEKTICTEAVSHNQLFSKLFSKPYFWPPKMTKTSVFTEAFDWCGKQDLNHPWMINSKQ